MLLKPLNFQLNRKMLPKTYQLLVIMYFLYIFFFLHFTNMTLFFESVPNVTAGWNLLNSLGGAGLLEIIKKGHIIQEQIRGNIVLCNVGTLEKTRSG